MCEGKYILFRGLSLEKRDWVYGDIIQPNLSDPLRNRYRTMFIRCHDTSSTIQVDPLTVGQFTGILDKNKIKIFEGDKIFNVDNLYYDGIIYYYQGSFGLDLLYDLVFIELSGFSKESLELLEVIGNKYI
jgi:uncharacterized phage protein (TIGR01671 family)